MARPGPVNPPLDDVVPGEPEPAAIADRTLTVPAVSSFRVELRSVDGGPTGVASSGPHSVLTDRPAAAGGRGLGFNGGQLLYAAIAGCYSNDLYREAATLGIRLTRILVAVDGDFPARGAAVNADHR